MIPLEGNRRTVCAHYRTRRKSQSGRGSSLGRFIELRRAIIFLPGWGAGEALGEVIEIGRNGDFSPLASDLSAGPLDFS
jgi:hypothetical protein